jgi:hypothetical protein
MMRELGGVFGIAVTVAVFAAAGSYASPTAFTDGLAPAIGVGAGLSLAGALAATALPGRRSTADERAPEPVPALEAEGGRARIAAEQAVERIVSRRAAARRLPLVDLYAESSARLSWLPGEVRRRRRECPRRHGNRPRLGAGCPVITN